MPRFYELSECTAMLRKTASIYRGVPLVSHSNFWIIWLCWDPNLGCGEFWRDPLLSCKRVKVRCRASPRKMWDSLSGFVLFFFFCLVFGFNFAISVSCTFYGLCLIVLFLLSLPPLTAGHHHHHCFSWLLWWPGLRKPYLWTFQSLD